MRSKDLKNIPLSESNVSLKLSLIQRRCAKLAEDDELELSLEEPAPEPVVEDDGNPYSRG